MNPWLWLPAGLLVGVIGCYVALAVASSRALDDEVALLYGDAYDVAYEDDDGEYDVGDDYYAS